MTDEEKALAVVDGALGALALWLLFRPKPACVVCPTCPTCQTCHDPAIGCVPGSGILIQGASGSATPGAAVGLIGVTGYPIAIVTYGLSGSDTPERYAMSGQVQLVSTDPSTSVELGVVAAWGPYPNGGGGLAGEYYCPALAAAQVVTPGAVQPFRADGDLDAGFAAIGTPVQLFLAANQTAGTAPWSLLFPAPVLWSAFIPCTLLPCPAPVWLGP